MARGLTMWDFPRPGMEPVNPALAGGFLTTTLSGKSASVLNRQFPCMHDHKLCSANNNKFGTCFYSFCLLETFLISNGARARTTLLLASSPLVD